MIQISIEEPSIEQFFNHSKEEIINTLKFIADNNLKGFKKDTSDYALTVTQKSELAERIGSFHKDPSMGRTWDEIKTGLKR